MSFFFVHFLAIHTPSIWFRNLYQDDKDKIVELLSQGIAHYGSFTQDVKEDMIAKFGINNNQAQHVYDFLYCSRNLFF